MSEHDELRDAYQASLARKQVENLTEPPNTEGSREIRAQAHGRASSPDDVLGATQQGQAALFAENQELKTELERVRAERDELQEGLLSGEVAVNTALRDKLDTETERATTWKVERDEAQARLDRAVEALRPEKLAQSFHEAYERLAPEFGYETREDSAVAWEDVPEKNKRLMIATADAISRAALAEIEESR